MNEPTFVSEIQTNGDSRLLKLKVTGVIGGPSIVITDESGKLQLKVPSQLWPWLVPGDVVFTTIGVFKVSLADAPLTGLPGGLQVRN